MSPPRRRKRRSERQMKHFSLTRITKEDASTVVCKPFFNRVTPWEYFFHLPKIPLTHVLRDILLAVFSLKVKFTDGIISVTWDLITLVARNCNKMWFVELHRALLLKSFICCRVHSCTAVTASCLQIRSSRGQKVDNNLFLQQFFLPSANKRMQSFVFRFR